MKRLIPVLALTLSLTACAAQEPAPTATPTPAPTPAPVETPVPVPTALKWTDQVYEKEFTADDGTRLMTVRYVLPDIVEASAVPAWSKISGYYADEGNAALTAASENADLARDDYHIAKASGYDFIPYAEELSYQVTRESGTLASIKRTYYSNMGGAYPVSYQFCETFDLSTGGVLALSDCFAGQDWQARVLSAMEQQSMELELGLTLDDLERAFQPACFYLTEDSLVIYYQEGTFGGHALGLTEFPIPYADLEDIWIK